MTEQKLVLVDERGISQSDSQKQCRAGSSQ